MRFAFEYALAHGRRKVTICHKANILKAASGLCYEVGHDVALDYEGRVAVDAVIIDAAAMKLVLDPGQFDMIVTTNMFGDIPSDQIAGLVGGLGMAPGHIRAALRATLRDRDTRTPDLGGNATTTDFAYAVLRRLG